MNGRRFGNSFTPSSFSSSSSSYHTVASLLAASSLFFFSRLAVYMYIYTARGLHQAYLSSLEGKVTSRGLSGQREAQPRTIISRTAATARHCQDDLRGLHGFLSKKKKTRSLSPLASLNLSNLPRFLMPSPIPRCTSRLKPLCREMRTLMDSGI